MSSDDIGNVVDSSNKDSEDFDDSGFVRKHSSKRKSRKKHDEEDIDDSSYYDGKS
jgi:hypothetical protein